MPEGLERMLLGYKKEVEDEIYQNTIIMTDLIKEKKTKFARQDTLVAQVKESKKRKRISVENKKIVPIVRNEVTQRLTQYITNEMNGKEVKVVIQKTLFASDLLKNLNRLNMPFNQFRLETCDFLTKDEKRIVKGEGLEVELLGPKLKMHKKPMVLKRWKMTKSVNYVLKTNWNSFVKENEKDLKEKTMIQVWSFPKDEKLHFAIACLDKDIDVQNVVPASSIPINLLPPKKRWAFRNSLHSHR